ncbi:hypothetical protein NHX12_030914, partial [Muraenolepis orangiensis]
GRDYLQLDIQSPSDPFQQRRGVGSPSECKFTDRDRPLTKISCPRSPLDQLEDTGTEQLRHQQLEKVSPTSGGLPPSVHHPIPEKEVGPLRVLMVGHPDTRVGRESTL